MARAIPILIVAAGIGLIGYSATKNDNAADRARSDPIANAEAKKRWSEIDRQEQVRKISIKKCTWHKGGFNNVMIATFALQNNNSFGVKDIVVRCEHYAPSGTLIYTNTRTIYQAIKPMSSITVRDFNMGADSHPSCAIIVRG